MLIRIAFRNLTRNLRRTLAVLLMISLGTGALLAFKGFNKGIMNQYRVNTIHARYGHGQVHTRGYRDQVYERPWDHWIESPQDTFSKLHAIPGVAALFPRVHFFALLTNGEITVSGSGQGIDGPSEADFFTSLNIEEGETLSHQSDGILLGAGLARSLKVHPGDRVTALVTTVYGSMNAADFTVTGIFHTGAKEFDDVVFRVPLLEAQLLLDTEKVESVAVGLDEREDWDLFVEHVTRELPELETTSFAELDKVYYQHSVDWLDSQFGVIQGIILTIVLLGIFNMISTAILERKQEVGMLRANGESSWEVLHLFVLEGILLGLLGAGIGVAFTLLLQSTLLSEGILMPPAPGLTRQFQVLLEFDSPMITSTFLTGAFAAAVATSFAAFRIVRIPIAHLLRST